LKDYIEQNFKTKLILIFIES